jgi:hypothetical protein
VHALVGIASSHTHIFVFLNICVYLCICMPACVLWFFCMCVASWKVPSRMHTTVCRLRLRLCICVQFRVCTCCLVYAHLRMCICMSRSMRVYVHVCVHVCIHDNTCHALISWIYLELNQSHMHVQHFTTML